MFSSYWAYVETTLIKSIREGVLFNRKYWARHSKTGDVLKLVYFSSIIMSDKVEELNHCGNSRAFPPVRVSTFTH